jgi:hypothetical protein
MGYHKMKKIQVKIYNCETGEETVRDATAEELAQFEIEKENAKAKQTEAEAKAAQKQEILDRIGLTADELKMILG